MGELEQADAASTVLVRTALLITATLGGAGSILGLVAMRHGSLSIPEAVLVLSSCPFVAVVLAQLLICRKACLRGVAVASTVYYAAYLVACVLVTVRGPGENENLFIYLLWFFPLLVFNRLVNGRRAGRILGPLLLAALLLLLPKLLRYLSTDSFFHVVAFSISYLCFGLMLNVVTRYREEYIVARERAERFRMESAILESISDGFLSLDAEGRLVYLNDAACEELGVDRSAALGKTLDEAASGRLAPAALEELRAAAARAQAYVFEAGNAEGNRWYEMRCYPRRHGPGGLQEAGEEEVRGAESMTVYIRNATERVLGERRLQAATAQLRERSELLDKAQDAIFVQNMESQILYWNKGAERLFGWCAEEVLGRRVDEVFHLDRTEILGAFDRVVRQGEWKGELTKRDKAHRRLVVESRCTVVRAENGEPRSILVINTDITERKASQAKIRHLAYYDALTGLPNRELLRERLECVLGGSGRECEQADEQELGALLFIDVDDFKTLNDTLGHAVGDQLLRQMARRIEKRMPDAECVARFGGDEFVVVRGELGRNEKLAGAQARGIGRRLLRELRQPYALETTEYQGTVSIGIALYRCGVDRLDDVLKRADAAMYRAKAQGRDRVRFFDPEMERCVAERAALQADLRKALRTGGFELHYQPQLDRRGRTFGCEALLRWRHPQRGMVRPDEFIPLAEEAGLIVELGGWVLREACGRLAAWARRPELQEIGVAVNVSARQFLDPWFVRRVEAALRETGANPRRLKLEITESCLIERVEETIAKIMALRSQGVQFSVDDFGMGYSSLSQLRRLPLDQIKIDRSFVQDATTSTTGASLVRGLIDLARILRLQVIAEGVETAEQLALLEENGCFAYQGFLFSRALPAEEFERFAAGTQADSENTAWALMAADHAAMNARGENGDRDIALLAEVLGGGGYSFAGRNEAPAAGREARWPPELEDFEEMAGEPE